MKLIELFSVATFVLACSACGDDKPSGQPDAKLPADAKEIDAFVPQDAPAAVGKLVINEVQANGTAADWVELYNGTNADIDLSTYYVVDTNPNTDLPEALTGTIAAKSYRVLLRKVNAVGDFTPGLKTDVEGFKIFSDNGMTVVDEVGWTTDPGYVDTVSTYGRYPDGTGDFAKMAETKGVVNTAPI